MGGYLGHDVGGHFFEEDSPLKGTHQGPARGYGAGCCPRTEKYRQSLEPQGVRVEPARNSQQNQRCFAATSSLVALFDE